MSSRFLAGTTDIWKCKECNGINWLWTYSPAGNMQFTIANGVCGDCGSKASVKFDPNQPHFKMLTDWIAMKEMGGQKRRRAVREYAKLADFLIPRSQLANAVEWIPPDCAY